MLGQCWLDVKDFDPALAQDCARVLSSVPSLCGLFEMPSSDRPRHNKVATTDDSPSGHQGASSVCNVIML